MILNLEDIPDYFNCDLHVCGDDPATILRQSGYGPVISTYVEMIPITSAAWKTVRSDLHVCGDDPMVSNESKFWNW